MSAQPPKAPSGLGFFLFVIFAVIMGFSALKVAIFGMPEPPLKNEARIASPEPPPAKATPVRETIAYAAFIERKATDNLKAGLRDPDGARLRREFVPRGETYLCGEVNAANAFGGMSGYRRFIAGAAPEVPVAIEGETMDPSEFERAWTPLCAGRRR